MPGARRRGAPGSHSSGPRRGRPAGPGVAGARIPGVTPLILLLPGALALVAGVALLRGFGPGYRIGRLLASTPVLPLPEVLALADGPERYVGVRGRIDAEEPFEDDAHRPLVLQRRRLARARRAGLADRR